MPSAESQAAHILSILYSAQTNDQHLVRRVQDAVHQTGWTQHLAVAIFTNLESALQKEMLMNQVMKEAYHRASQVVSDIWKFAKEHPVICALVALGILTILMPWVISALGFGELGPIEGTFAAWWQSKYAGYVPVNSLFSFFQRLGMWL